VSAKEDIVEQDWVGEVNNDRVDGTISIRLCGKVVGLRKPRVYQVFQCLNVVINFLGDEDRVPVPKDYLLPLEGLPSNGPVQKSEAVV